MKNAVIGSPSIGELIHNARLERGFTCRSLAAASGVAQSQISKLEQDKIAKINPAHLALLAEPLDLSLHALYVAAGYQTPSALDHLSAELEAKLRLLSPSALSRLEEYVEDLLRGGSDREGLKFTTTPDIN